MASREGMGRGHGRGRGRWQKRWSKQHKNKPQRNDLEPADHPDVAIWRVFPLVRIETSYDFKKEDIRRLCVPYGEIVGSRKYVKNDTQSYRNYRDHEHSRRGWRSGTFRNDRIQRGAEIIATYQFTYSTDEAASNCAQALHGHTLEGYRISAWSHQGERRCCPRPLSGRSSPANFHDGKSDPSCIDESSQLDHQNSTENIGRHPRSSSTNIGTVQSVVPSEPVKNYETSNKPTDISEGYEIEKCISSNEAMNILDGIEIVTPDHYNILDQSKKVHTSEFGGKNNQDEVIITDDCDSFSNEKNFEESQESIRNQISDANDIICENASADDTGVPIEMSHLEFNSLLEFLQTNEESVTKDINIDNENSDPLTPTKKSSHTKKKKKKKQPKKDEFNSEQGRREYLKNERPSLTNKGYIKTERSFSTIKDLGNWRCPDPSCNSFNYFDDALCTRCKLPCPEAMKENMEKSDENRNHNKYYLAYAKSSVEIYFQDYTQHRDASKMTEILNKRFENGHKTPDCDKVKKDGVFAVMTAKGWVRGRVLSRCNGIKCSLQNNSTTKIDVITKQKENMEIENNGHLDCLLIYSSNISYESNYKYNVNEEYYEKNVNIPVKEVTTSVLEHQIMIEAEYNYTTITQKYFESIYNFNKQYQDDYAKTLQNIELTTSVLEHQILVEENAKYEICIHNYLNSMDNIHGGSQGKNAKIPQSIEFPLSVLEHQLIIEREYEYENSIQTYLTLNHLLAENANIKIVPSLKYLGNKKLQENQLNQIKEANNEKNNERYENKNISEVKYFDLIQDRCRNVHKFSFLDEETNNKIFNVVPEITLKLDIESKDCEEGFDKDFKFCHVSLIDYGECSCVATDKLGLLLREFMGITEMKTGPVYLDHCMKIDQTDEKEEDGRKFLESVLADKSFQLKWKTGNEKHVEIFINDKHFNKEVCDRGYAIPQGLLCRKCYKCDKIGHVTRECPDKIKPGKCYNCGDKGHRKQNCNVLSKIMKYPVLKVETKPGLLGEYSNDTHIENSHNDRQSLDSTCNIIKKIRQRLPSDSCQVCGGNTDHQNRTCNCHYDLKNTTRNYDRTTIDTLTNYDYNTIDTYGNNRREITDKMVNYDNFYMSESQDRFRNMSEYIPKQNYEWFGHPMIRSNLSMQSSVISSVQNPYWMTPNDVYEASELSATMLAQANYDLSHKDGHVRALEEELARIRTTGYQVLLEVMKKMKSLVIIDSNLTKRIGPNEPMEKAIAFLNDYKENMRHLMTTDGQINLDDFLLKSKNSAEESKSPDVHEWLTPQEQLAAMKVHQKGMRIILKDPTITRTKNLEMNLTYDDAIQHYYKWKVYYEKSYARATAYYNGTFTEWITFSNDAKNILDGAPDPKKPEGADIKKFYEQETKLKKLFIESEQILENLPKLIFTKITSIILQLEKFVLKLENIEKSKKQEHHLSANDESSPGITLAQYVQNTKQSLPHSQVDKIVKEILEEVNTEHYGNNSFGCIHPQNILVTDEGVKLCRTRDISAQMKIEDWDFTAPEALQGKPVKASDIYSIGKIMMWLTFCNEKYSSIKQAALETMPYVSEMVKKDPAERPSIQKILSNEPFALPLHREAEKKKNHVEKINILGKIDEEFADEIQESLEENT